MNYLAHSLLSGEDDNLFMGNYLADMLRNRDLASLPSEWQRGVDLHRQIDSYTDSHIQVRRATALLRPSQGKYAPVVVDVAFDYVLAMHWDSLGVGELEVFIDDTYTRLERHLDQAPSRAQGKVQGMIEHDALRNYISWAGLRQTMHYLDRRAKYTSNFLTAVDDIEAHYAELEESFLAFWPELEGMCRAFRAEERNQRKI